MKSCYNVKHSKYAFKTVTGLALQASSSKLEARATEVDVTEIDGLYPCYRIQRFESITKKLLFT